MMAFRIIIAGTKSEIIPPNSALDCEIELLQVRGHETLPD